jgi:hypothetical protein
VEPTVEHRNVATCRARETKAVAQPLPVPGMQVHVSPLSCPDRTSSGPVQPVARAAASTRLIVASAARQVSECVSGLLQAAQAHKGSDKVRWQSDGNHLRMLTGTRCPTPSLPRGAICVPRSRARPFAALSICCGKPQLCAVNGNGDRVGRLGWVGAAAGRFLRRSRDWCFRGEAGRRPDLACAVGPQMRTGTASGYGTGFLYGRRRPAGLAASVY